MRMHAMYRQGFTLVEMAITLVVMGILLSVLMPRLFDTGEFSTRSFADALIADLRFAREEAIAQRAPIYVSLTAGQAQFCLDAACTQPATGADGKSPFVLATPGGVSLGTTASFRFDALGATDLSSALAVSIVGSPALTVTIESDTGYVH